VWLVIFSHMLVFLFFFSVFLRQKRKNWVDVSRLVATATPRMKSASAAAAS